MPFRSLTLAALLLAAPSVCRLGAVPYGAGDHDVSEYMMGSVTVNIIFPESSASSPDTEDWTAFRKASVESSIRAAMDWWAAREPEARLSFVYNVTTQNTDYEPIACYASAEPPPGGCSEGDWIGDIMTKMGYTGSDYFEKVYAYDDAMRLAYGTDWAFTIFVADSFMDGDGTFPDGYFAYTYMGGPFMVLTYDNGAYGISGMSAVCAHETGHVFYALDEYAESGCATTERAGYFNAPNLNCQNGGTSEQCIMRGQLAPYDTPAVCNNTRLMLGWKDVSPANGVPDIVDLTPTTALTAYSPDPTTDNTPAYYGIAHSTALYPNANQYEAPAMRFYYETPPPVKDISVLRLAAVEYQVDGGAWQQASPRDSGFDSVVDSFTFTTAALSNAAHTIRARAKDNFGNYDPSPPSDALTVNNALPSDILHVYDGTTTAFDLDFTRNSGSLSANWDASSYMGGNPAYYEYRIGITPGGAEISGWTNVGVTTGVTRTGLSLTESATYYFAVRAAGLPGPFYSGVTVSDGQRVDVTSPTARVEISSALPAKTGSLSLKLIVSEANGLLGTPTLSFTTADGAGHSVALTYLANTSTWTASTYIESWYSTGTAVFSFGAVDTAGNRGTVITSGGSFSLDTAVSGAAGAVVSNSDAYSVTLPAGVYSGNLLVSISTIPASRTALADAARSESVPLKGSDLTREFTARSPSGALISGFLAPVTIKLCYPDADNDGRIDGDYIEESRTGLYWLDESSSRWTRVNGAQRLTASNCLSAQVSHFSVYSVRALDAAETGLGSVKAFPSPCYFDRAPGVLTIRGIPLDALRPEIEIYNVAGELVRTLKPGDGIDPFYNDGLWDGRQSGGAKAASGLYVYVVRTGNYGKTTGKFYIFW